MEDFDLSTLGHLMTTLHREMYEVRAGQTALSAETRSELSTLRAFVAAHLTGVQIALETRFDQRLERLETRVSGLEMVLRAVNQRLDLLDRLDALTTRFDTLEDVIREAFLRLEQQQP